MFRNTKRQGDAGVAAALYYYVTVCGYGVSLPFGDSERYDLIVDKNNTLYRVQCKTSTCVRNASYQVTLTTSGGNGSTTTKKTLSTEEADTLFVWCSDGAMYEIPISSVEGMKMIVLPGSHTSSKVHGEHRTSIRTR